MRDIKFKEASNGKEHIYTLKRSVFERECEHLFDRCSQAVERAVSDANLDGEIHEVVLVSGSCKMPRIRQVLVEQLGYFVTINDEIDVKEVVARGAAILAGTLTNHNQRKFILNDIVPISIRVSAEPEEKTS